MQDSKSSKKLSQNPFGESGVFRFYETDDCGSMQVRYAGLAKSEWVWSIDCGNADSAFSASFILCIKDEKENRLYATEKSNFLEYIKKNDPDNLNWILFNLDCTIGMGAL